ncbi:MAG TPA: hypothetical protein VMD56_01785 [Steroidobacteraceae bacterium]|nr:hypothetical protein [Steroidobacteraceae bacterium]
MSDVDGTVSSQRVTFWTRSQSWVLTWPVLPALLVLLLLAGLIAVAHYCASRRLWPQRVPRLPGPRPVGLGLARAQRSGA